MVRVALCEKVLKESHILEAKEWYLVMRLLAVLGGRIS
jgi:hypothetical protein